MHKHLSLIIVTLIVVACGSHRTAVLPPEVPEAQRRVATYVFGEAARGHACGEAAEAYDLMYNTLRINPDHAPSLALLSTYEQYLRNTEAADSMLSLALAIDPANTDYMEQEAVMAERSGDIDRIIAIYERLAEARPRSQSILWTLSKLYIKDYQSDNAVKVLNRIENIQGINEQTASMKYYVHLMDGDTIRAVRELQALVEEYPSDPNNLVLLGKAYYSVLNDIDSAQVIFDRVAAIDPANRMLQMEQLKLYQYADSARYDRYFNHLLYAPDTDDEVRSALMIQFIGQHQHDSLGKESTIAMFDSITARPQNSSRLLATYAAYLLSIDAEADKLNRVLNGIIDIEPSNRPALMQLLQNYAKENNSDEVARICDIGITNYPHEALFYYYSALGYYIKGDSITALDRVTTGCEHINDETTTYQAASMYSMQGDILHNMGRHEESYQAYDSCLLYEPDNVQCLNNYAYYLSIEGGDLQKAEEMSYRTIRKEPDNKTYLDTYAWILYLQGRYDEAANYMDRVMEGVDIEADELPDSISQVVLEHAADIYGKTGDRDKERAYRKAAKKK